MANAPAVPNPWVARIETAYRSTLESSLEVGRLLLAAKADLPHGEFLAMTRQRLPFSARYAQMYMRIAEHPGITNANNSSHLPRAVRTLYELSRLPAGRFDALLAEGAIHPEMRCKELTSLNNRMLLEDKHTRAAALNLGHAGSYAMGIADPPWRTRGWVPPYPTMSVSEICDLRIGPDGSATDAPDAPHVSDMFANNAVMFMWAIPLGRAWAEDAMQAWGFELVDEIIWDKEFHARPGHCALRQHEYLLVGTRGDAQPVWRPRSVVRVARSGLDHSEKPVEFHEMAQKMFPMFTPRLELFSRRARPGWDGWGNQYPAAPSLSIAA